MADDRIRELEIMIRLIDIEIILARRREGRQGQVSRQVVPVGPPAHQGRQGQQVEVVGGPWWHFLYSCWENLPWWGFFWGPSSSFEALCSKYSVVSRWQQVVVFSVVFECCMIIHELCTDVETVCGRT